MHRVLVIRFSSLGDIILTSPVVEGLKQAYPDGTVDYLVHRRFVSVVERFATSPDNIKAFDENTTALGLPRYVRELSIDGYDLVIDLHGSLRSSVIRQLIKCSELRIYRKPRINRALLFYLHRNRFPDDFNLVKNYLSYAGLKALNIDPRPKMHVDKPTIDAIKRKFDLPDQYTVCIPGAAWPQKSWPAEKYVEVFNRRTIEQRKMVLLGGPGDGICDRIAGNLSDRQLLNLRGRSKLDETLAIIAGSGGAIGADTGLMHAAEAFGKPVVLILGPTSKETGAGVHLEQSILHENKMWCRPCSQNGKRPCYQKQQYCLTNTSSESVLESLRILELD